MGDTGSDSVSPAVVSAFSPVASGSKNLGSSIPTSNLALPPLISCKGRGGFHGFEGGTLAGGFSSMGDGGPSSEIGFPSIGETGRSSGVLASGASSSGDSSGDCSGDLASEGFSSVGSTLCGVLISEALNLLGASSSGLLLRFGSLNLGSLIF